MAVHICIPGELIGTEDKEHLPGNGAYARNGKIFASLGGRVEHSKNSSTNQTCINVRNPTKTDVSVVPAVGALVTTKIKSVNRRFCKCEIYRVNKTMLKEPFRGVIIKEDVRATEKDKIEMSKSFRPGDVVQARVMCLGEATTYLLSTAENELGVVIATSEAGVSMVPISWQEMQCPKTFTKEFRKVAKVQPQFIVQS